MGTVSGIGAALSTTVSGFVAQRFGAAAGFYVMTGVALIAVAVCWAFMPETKVTPLQARAREKGEGGKRHPVQLAAYDERVEGEVQHHKPAKTGTTLIRRDGPLASCDQTRLGSYWSLLARVTIRRQS